MMESHHWRSQVVDQQIVVLTDTLRHTLHYTLVDADNVSPAMLDHTVLFPRITDNCYYNKSGDITALLGHHNVAVNIIQRAPTRTIEEYSGDTRIVVDQVNTFFRLALVFQAPTSVAEIIEHGRVLEIEEITTRMARVYNQAIQDALNLYAEDGHAIHELTIDNDFADSIVFDQLVGRAVMDLEINTRVFRHRTFNPTL